MISQATKKQKVFVGLSGGVDSAVSAALLKRAGYDVTGVFIKVWQPDWINCTWKEERRMAMRVAAKLDIPFVTLDLVKEYKKDVIDYMIREYSAGRTPNPDVMCNRYVKFGGFWQWAKNQGADYIATGHYARVVKKEDQAVDLRADVNDHIPIPAFSMLAGIDTNKDQSYFLWTFNQKDLSHVLFPVGGITKPEVRKLAKKFELPNAEKKDSQGLCFIGKLNVKEFLSHYIKTEPGKVLNEHGEVIGTHPGALFFTIGERHGFVLTIKTPNDRPFYVVDKDVEQNTIIVSNKKIDQPLNSPGTSFDISVNTSINAPIGTLVRITNVNWVSDTVPSIRGQTSYNLQARSRYREPLQNIRIISIGITETVLEFEKPQDTITPGQSLVIYDGDKCLGGGIID